MNPDAVPAELRDREQWINWRTECRDKDCLTRTEPTVKSCPECGEDTTKRPIIPGTDNWADATDSDTWRGFSAAVEGHHSDDTDTDGLGFAFAPDDLTVGIDLDGCRDPDNGQLEPWANDIVETVDSYAEVSPSGTGVHVLAFGVKPGDNCRTGGLSDSEGDDLEMYDSTRYFTVTGERLDGAPQSVEARPDACKQVYNDHLADADPDTESVAETPAEPIDLDDAELVQKAKKANDGGKFEALWRGDISDYDSHSEADLALCSKLAFWTAGDRKRIEALFRQSGLYRDKWDRDDYRQRTIDKALKGQTEFYDPEASQRRAAADGGAAAAEPGGDTGPDGPGVNDRPAWADVISLFESEANGTTTEAYAKAADIIDRTYDLVTLRESEAAYFYDPDAGHWVRKGESYIAELLERHIPNHLNESRKRNIREKVRDRNIISSDEFQPPEGKLCVENGVLDLETWELEPHSPEYYFTAKVRAEWPEDGEPDPRGEARWIRALEDATDNPDERKKIEEFGGYICEPWHHAREKNMVLVGPPQSGKSTLQEAIESLFGTEPTVSNLTPQQIADTQFDAARLREAMLNTVNDINATKIEDTGTLKRVWSGERTKMENKFEDAHFAAPNAKHLFTANWVPRLVGQDESVYRRMLIVEFTKSIPDSQKDKRYKERLKRPHVRQAMLYRFLKARDRLNKQDHFTNDRTRSETRELYNSWRDAHRRFLYEQFEITMDPDNKVDREAYNRALQEYCGRKDYAPVSRGSVTKTLQYVPGVYAGGSGDTYGGLKWKDRDAAEETDGQIDDPKHTVKSHIEANYEPEEEFTPSEIAGQLMDSNLSPEKVGHQLTRLAQNQLVGRDGDTYWLL